MDDDHEGHPHPTVQDAPEQALFERRVDALQALLIEKGLITADEVRQAVEEMDSRSPALGTRVVARAWTDPAFKARLLADAKSAIAELGIDVGAIATIIAVENTEAVHHVVVCTLCSCYPRGLLGYPPDWYKSLNYRSRVVVDPRGVLKEFGLELDPDVQVRVLDSTADMRYLVIPARPAGTEQMGEDELAGLVTRDSMIGVAKTRTARAR
ncbi:MAG: nitrile hydratase subunit alpha [Candidatus Rokubacteria bacterium]|nr:nitrile hydratase subunit alpha [Candidatus Rokubacteria bacterium]